ncbi:MAG: zinc ribbon domain-containing protein [Acetatifactor sp.]
MYCDNCGTKVEENASFCTACGKPVSEIGSQSSAAGAVVPTPQLNEEISYMNPSDYSNIFIDPEEQLLGTLGNGYLENILHRKVKKCHALLTDKRIYFQGTFYTGNGKQLQQKKSEKIVDLEDITGTGFLYSKPLGILASIIWIVIPLLLFLFCLVWSIKAGNEEYVLCALGVDVIAILRLIIRYLLNRNTFFEIEYAGGSIRFNAQIIGLSAVKDFQKQIRRAKDAAKGKDAKCSAATVETP